MAKEKKCKIKGCTEPHHARGYCNRHYKKLMQVGDPLAGRTYQSGPRNSAASRLIPTDREPEKRKRLKKEENMSFLLNEKIITALYNEAAKAQQEPLYIAANGHHVTHFLTMALLLSGFDDTNKQVYDELMEDLMTWSRDGDKLRFLHTLQNWEERAEAITTRKTKQMALKLL